MSGLPSANLTAFGVLVGFATPFEEAALAGGMPGIALVLAGGMPGIALVLAGGFF